VNFNEAVEVMKGTMTDQLNEERFRDYMQDVIEDIIIEYYKFDFGNVTEEDFEDEEIALEDFLWADIGAIALHRIADEWANGRPKNVRFRVPRAQPGALL
jgi:hypothetical protein